MADDHFSFDLDAKRIRITDIQMIESLKEFYRIANEKPFTTNEYDAWSDSICSSQTISRRFGTWREALSRIGIHHGVRAHTYTDQELMDNLESVWRKLGYPPGKRQLAKCGYRISERPYCSRWGSVRKACQRLKLFKDGKIDESQLFDRGERKTRKTISAKVRWDIFQRYNSKCVKCGNQPPDVKLEIDHIVPLSLGGTDEETNLQILCNRCNSGKSNQRE